MTTHISDDKINVLIVSSNNTLRRSIEEGLKSFDYETYSAADGESALALIKQRKLDTAITSVELQGMNGVQLSQAIARIHPHVPIIVVTKFPEPTQVAQVLSSGASDLISETVMPDEMDAIIRQCIERKVAPTRKIISDRAETLFKALKVLTAAIDAKSHFAAKHSTRVTQLSLLVGARLGLTSDQMMTLELAAQMHDVGKIGTPEAVLTKPDVLTDEEWVDVLKHPTLGSSFLSTVPELSEIASIVRHHHEHFDGTGYPDGLQGPAIPLMSRIIAVADAYDAMTSERPYRKARTHEQAIEELQMHSGRQFDPTLVHHLIAAINEQSKERKAA